MRGTGRVLFVQHQDDCPPGHVGERVEQRGARVEVVRAQSGSLPDPRLYDLVVPLGSDDSAYDESLPYLRGEWELLAAAVDAGVPVFGICFGAQLLARVLGGEVHRASGGPEIGWLTVRTTEPGLVDSGPWLVWHLDVIGAAPPAARANAHTDVGIQAFTCGPHVGTQFHPEATPDSARVWAERYRESLREIGVDAGALLAETDAGATAARRRGHRLTDRVMEHALAVSAGSGH